MMASGVEECERFLWPTGSGARSITRGPRRVHDVLCCWRRVVRVVRVVREHTVLTHTTTACGRFDTVMHCTKQVLSPVN